MKGKEITIYVEGKRDVNIVEYLLDALFKGRGLPSIRVVACGGKGGVKAKLHSLTCLQDVIALIDADESSVADSVLWAKKYLDTPEANVFCAVPTIEAWVFADKDLALRHASAHAHSDLVSSIARVVTPESLPLPKLLARKFFSEHDNHANFPFLRDVTVAKAVAASASLFQFLRGVEQALGHSWMHVEQNLTESLNRRVFANLLGEIPSETIGWRTLDGEYSVAELSDSILQGNELGLRYMSEVLRLARDILVARAEEPDDHA